MTTKPVILAIDDTPLNLAILRETLVPDYEVHQAQSGIEGLAIAASTLPDLILLDIMMPGMDGFEVCQRLKADQRLRDIPVIFITAMTEAETECLTLGAADYLCKPLNVPIVKLRIHNLLEREALRKQLELHRDQLEEQVKERTLSLSIAREAAEAADRLKSQILSNISHEFRTPMQGILGMLGLAEHHTTDPKLRDYLKRAEQSAKRLMSTLNGLVDLAATEANRLTLERAPLRIIDVIEKALADQQENARAKGLTLALENPESARLAPDFMGDALRIHQIIDELISNAIKFSPKGAIRVRTGAIRNAAGEHELHCTVSDEGIGIAAEPLAHIFDPFWQAEEAMWHGYDGKGIGLALCQRLARAMGGSLSVESTPGQGSRFTLIIPLQLADEAPESIRADALARLKASYAGASVLAAEDDEINLAILTDYLDEAGISVFGVSNGAEAVEAAKAACFDLILMDLMMPVMSGIEATHAIRDLPKYGKTPIVAVTACVFENDREECLRAGMTDFVRKPVIPEVLYEVILSAFEESQAASIAHMNAA